MSWPVRGRVNWLVAALRAMDRLTDAAQAGKPRPELDRLQREYDSLRLKARGQEAAMVCMAEGIPYRKDTDR